MDLKEGAMGYIDMFRRYGWVVDILGHNDFIAHNDTYFVPFSVAGRYVSAVSYLLCDKEEFVASWKKLASYQPIGSYAFHDFMLGAGQRKFHQFGALGNHDHDAIEISRWLDRIRKNKEEK